MTTPRDYEDVLDFWFGPLDEEGRADAVHRKTWFTKDPAFDETLRQRFGALHSEIASGGRDAWLESGRGRLAFVIVLDQFSRNMFRGSAKMFAADARALEASLGGIARGVDRSLRFDERSFLYMPLMHSEQREMQDRCLQLFEGWRDELEGEPRERVAGLVKYAVQHRDIVARFGRFPHRNELVGRASTPEETDFLSGPGSSF